MGIYIIYDDILFYVKKINKMVKKGNKEKKYIFVTKNIIQYIYNMSTQIIRNRNTLGNLY